MDVLRISRKGDVDLIDRCCLEGFGRDANHNT